MGQPETKQPCAWPVCVCLVLANNLHTLRNACSILYEAKLAFAQTTDKLCRQQCRRGYTNNQTKRKSCVRCKTPNNKKTLYLLAMWLEEPSRINLQNESGVNTTGNASFLCATENSGVCSPFLVT